MLPDPPDTSDVASLADALRMEAAVGRVAADLRAIGGRVMPLKGPAVQRRVLGSPAASPSVDVDVLVAGVGPRATKAALERNGWQFSTRNGQLWRLDAAAAFVGHGVQLDVHWGLHVGLVSSRRMRPLTEALWAEAELHPGGWYEPPMDALATYLVLQGAHKFRHAGKRRMAEAAVEAAGGWARVLDLAESCGMGAVASAVQETRQLPSADPPDVLELTYGARRAAAIRVVRSRLPALLRGAMPPIERRR